jgi:hypothetical protein
MKSMTDWATNVQEARKYLGGLPKLDHREVEQELHRLNSRVEELAYAIEKMNPNESARAHLRAFWEMGE